MHTAGNRVSRAEAGHTENSMSSQKRKVVAERNHLSP